MPERELSGVIVAHTHRGPRKQRRELVLPEVRLPIARAAVIAVEIDVGESRRCAPLRAVRRPFIVIDRLRRTLTWIVVTGHEGEHILEVLDRVYRARATAVEVYIVGKLRAGSIVVAPACGIDVVDRFSNVQLLQQVPAKPAHVSAFCRPSVRDLALN